MREEGCQIVWFEGGGGREWLESLGSSGWGGWEAKEIDFARRSFPSKRRRQVGTIRKELGEWL